MKTEFGSARQYVMQALAQSHPELLRASDAFKAHRVAARNLQVQLAGEFPGVKFKVSTSAFGANGKCLWVQWLDGPTVDQVRPLGDLYSERPFGDIRESKPEFVTAWREAFGSVETVVSERSYSDEAISHALRRLEMQLGERFVALDATVNKCRNRSMFSRSVLVDGMGEVNAMDLVERVLDNTVWFAAA